MRPLNPRETATDLHDPYGEDLTVQLPALHAGDAHDHMPVQRPPRRRARRRRGNSRWMRITIVVICLGLVLSTGSFVWADSKLERSVNLGELPDRPPESQGTNYLLVGTDSREGLSQDDRDKLNTGDAGGSRTDSIIVVHTGEHGPTVMSLPRDSWVNVPSFIRPLTGRHYRPANNKINAAYSLGGPDLLVRTVERATGLHIDHYAEIGFAGFVNLVDALGGVEQCVNRPIKDKDSGLNLSKGCHMLDGAQALAFVRQRKQEKDGDLGRARNQQQFLADLAGKAAIRENLMRPNRLVNALSAGIKGLTVDEEMSMLDLANMLRALKSTSGGNAQHVELPLTTTGLRTSKGEAVQWDKPKTDRIFESLRKDRPVKPRGSQPLQR